MTDRLLDDIQRAATDRDNAIPGAAARLQRLLAKLRARGPYHLKRPRPAQKGSHDD